MEGYWIEVLARQRVNWGRTVLDAHRIFIGNGSVLLGCGIRYEGIHHEVTRGTIVGECGSW